MTKAEFDLINWNKDTRVKLKGDKKWYRVFDIDFRDYTIHGHYLKGAYGMLILSKDIESVKQKATL